MYTVGIQQRARRALARLAEPDYSRILDAIRALGITPRPVGCRKLTDRDGWRIRVGDYRVVYEVDDARRTVTVLDIGHRRDVYR
jgi:mRNA interferase RelE/StbE